MRGLLPRSIMKRAYFRGEPGMIKLLLENS